MKTNIEKVKQLIGKRMPSELINFDDTDLVDKTNRFKFEMQSEEEIELNSNRYYMLEQRRHKEMYDDFEEDEDEGEEDALEIGDYESPVLATIYLHVYSDREGKLSNFEVSKYVDCDGSISSGTPSDQETNDVLELFLELYEEGEME